MSKLTEDEQFNLAILELTFTEAANTLYRIAAPEKHLSHDEAAFLIEELADLRKK